MKRMTVGVTILILVFVGALVVGAAVSCSPLTERGTPSEVQSLRSDYCDRVLKPETCKVLVHRNEYQSISACSHAFDKDGFCTPPIASTIADMNDCALRIGRDWSTPEDCLSLHHE